jgi:hypothetical protein
MDNLKKGFYSISRETLTKFNQAKLSARSIDMPNRYQLYQMYDKFIEDDLHYANAINLRSTRISGLQFKCYGKTGKVDNASTDIFNDLWFYKFIDYYFKAYQNGNSLIEILPTSEVDINLIPKENVIPEFNMVKYNPMALTGDVNYYQPMLFDSLIEINKDWDKYNLGILVGISKLLMFKNEVIANWVQYGEVFGQPVRYAETSTSDPIELDRLEKFLSDMGRSSYAIIDANTKLNILSNGASSGHQLFMDFITFVNTEVSKVILGGTMLTDSGSSRSQSEVHLEGSLAITKSDIRNVEFIVNKYVIPKLQALGKLPSKYIKFSFNDLEVVSLLDKVAQDKFLVEGFGKDAINKDYFETRYNIKFTDQLNANEDNIPQEVQTA